MAVYTVHEPPPKRYEASSEPDRFAFVRDGFSFWAFLFGPLWMLRRRMWLVFIGYVVVGAALAFVLHITRATPGVTGFTAFLFALLVGLEAGTLRRFTLARRGFRSVGVVVADDRDLAERRFFDSWTGGDRPVPPPAPLLRRTPASSDVIGLFPDPGASR
jgi:hypothetical protein